MLICYLDYSISINDPIVSTVKQILKSECFHFLHAGCYHDLLLERK
jgi:hypothetical protein